MSSLREQIRNQMNLIETNELLEIWQNNDRAEWSDDAFEVIKEILNERGVDLPEQHKPVYEHSEKKNQEDNGFSAEELRIIDDENPPDFYDPLDVLSTTKWIDWMAKAMIVFTILSNVVNSSRTLQIVQSFFVRNPNPILVYVITGFAIVLNTVISIIVIYFPLKALAHILRILMEMEFRSRKGV